MDTTKKTTAWRISVWVLIFTLILTTISASFAFSVHATGGAIGEMGDAAKDATNSVGDAVDKVTDDIGNAVEDVKDKAPDGTVNDSDGMIGNENDEAGSNATMDEERTVGWLGLVIALAIIVIAIVLIIILIPRKKRK